MEHFPPPNNPYQELHCHIGGAVPAAVLWETLSNQGLQSHFQTFNELQEALTATTRSVRNLDQFLQTYFHTTEAIQSSPEAMAISTYQAVAKAYRRSQIQYIELRFNPTKRLRGTTHKMEAILLATLQGFQKAKLHYNVEGTIILSLGRDCSHKTNKRIVEAAIEWKNQGISGIDMAGPESQKNEKDRTWMEETTRLFSQARSAGLKTTYHIGESPDSGWKSVETILHRIRPDRIGHGIQTALAPTRKKREILETLAATGTCLEICPTVNITTRCATQTQLQKFARDLAAAGVPFTPCTDNPYLVHTNLEQEHNLLLGKDQKLRDWCQRAAHTHRFLKP